MQQKRNKTILFVAVEVIPLCYVLITGFIYNTVKHNTIFLVVF